MCADADVQKMQENRKKREDMCMQKNDTVVVEITDIGVNGEGIGKIDGDRKSTRLNSSHQR